MQTRGIFVRGLSVKSVIGPVAVGLTDGLRKTSFRASKQAVHTGCNQQLEAQIPKDAQDDDLRVEVRPLKSSTGMIAGISP
jgi:hypothetical protein